MAVRHSTNRRRYGVPETITIITIGGGLGEQIAIGSRMFTSQWPRKRSLPPLAGFMSCAEPNFGCSGSCKSGHLCSRSSDMASQTDAVGRKSMYVDHFKRRDGFIREAAIDAGSTRSVAWPHTQCESSRCRTSAHAHALLRL